MCCFVSNALGVWGRRHEVGALRDEVWGSIRGKVSEGARVWWSWDAA